MTQPQEPLVREFDAGRDQSTRRGTSKRTKIVIAAVTSVLVVLAAIAAWSGGSDGGEGMVFVIPEGAYKNVSTPGIDSAILLPTRIEFNRDDEAAITIVNNDVIDHRAGPFLVGAGQTYTQRFPEPGQYQIDCTVNSAESIVVTVEG